MKSYTAKNKIIALTAAWLLVTASMFLYFFKILDTQNLQALNSMADDRKNLVVLQTESQSFTQAQSDLQELAAKNYQPEDFFSKDISLVNEIQTLESLAQKYNLKMQLSGISGTVGSAPLAQTTTPIVIVPYNLNLIGNLSDVVNFMENLENLQFLTTLTGVSMSAGQNGQVNTVLTANFYLRK